VAQITLRVGSFAFVPPADLQRQSFDDQSNGGGAQRWPHFQELRNASFVLNSSLDHRRSDARTAEMDLQRAPA
jgi:hypothetical protein